LAFDGSGDYVTISAPGLSLTKDFNFSVWLYSNNPSFVRMSIFSQSSVSGSFSIECGTFQSNVATYMVFYTGTGVRTAMPNNSLVNNRWVFVSYNSLPSGAHEIYFNGIKQNLVTNTPTTFIGTDSNKHIGQRGNNSQYYNGLMDEVQIYSAALTSSQIQSQYYVGLKKLLAKGLMGEQEYFKRLVAK
jgi:hypothetical protein